MNSKYKPINPGERLEIIDFLRGFALLGILMVNLPLMNAPFTTEMGDFVLWTDKVNTWAAGFIRFFFTGKFYVLFSLLFGIGFYFFMRKVDEGNKGLLGVFKFRLFWLLIFGVLHILFLWYGDILHLYAIIGFIMLLFRKKSNKTLIIWAIVLILIPIVVFSFLALFLQFLMKVPDIAYEMNRVYAKSHLAMKLLTEDALQTYSTGTFTEIFNQRLQEYGYIFNALIYFVPNILAMFLVGMVLARKAVFENISSNIKFFKKLLIISLPIAIVGNIIFLYSFSNISMTEINTSYILYMTGSGIGGPAMTFVYISLIVMFFKSRMHLQIFKLFSKAGRMALTNYISHSVICSFLFYSYGFGLYGKVNILQGIIITILIFSAQLVWSHYWLKHYRFGPLEWLWRTLTYRKAQKMKREK